MRLPCIKPETGFKPQMDKMDTNFEQQRNKHKGETTDFRCVDQNSGGTIFLSHRWTQMNTDWMAGEWG